MPDFHDIVPFDEYPLGAMQMLRNADESDADEGEGEEIVPTFVNSGETLVVAADELLQECTVMAGGELLVKTGATVDTLMVSAGAALWVEPGCGISGLTIEAGGRVNGFRMLGRAVPNDFAADDRIGLVLGSVYVDDGIQAVLCAGQNADTCRVLKGGKFTFMPGAALNTSMIVYAGGSVNGFTAVATDFLLSDKLNPLVILCSEIEDDELIEYYVIKAGDDAFCHSGQKVINCNVPVGSVLFVAAEGSLVGDMSLEGRLVLEDGANADGARIDMILSSHERPNDTPFITAASLSLDSFSITVDSLDETGTCILVDGLNGQYNGSVVVKTADDALLATLSLADDACFEGTGEEYRLCWISQADGVLSFVVDDQPAATPVIYAFVKGGGLFCDGLDKVGIRVRQYRFNESDEWSAFQGGSIELPEGESNVYLRCVSHSGLDNALRISMYGASAADGRVNPFTVAFATDCDGILLTANLPDGSALSFASESNAISLYTIKDGITIDATAADGNGIHGFDVVASDSADGAMQYAAGTADGNGDVFVAAASKKWSSAFVASHAGSLLDGEVVGAVDAMVKLTSRNRIVDVFAGAGDDPCILLLTNDGNGDALFVDDIYSASFGDVGMTQSRLADITEIVAGAGDDIIDLTSERFAYTGGGVTVRGGDGDDVIWSNNGCNILFGDDGDDWLIGGVGDDVLVGGACDDILNGNGGDDIFCFGAGWGRDEVQQAEGGKVILWFAEGLDVAQNGRVFTCGDNSVTVGEGVEIEMRIGEDANGRYAQLCSLGAFI